MKVYRHESAEGTKYFVVKPLMPHNTDFHNSRVKKIRVVNGEKKVHPARGVSKVVLASTIINRH
jgi:hypothetical protein